ncbi:MAG TPA: hypothetical protein VGH28_08760 [Polyangiaceae bacterium]|jgi:hypothetical protein
MRFAALSLGLLLTSACSSEPISNSCPTPAIIGSSPHCVLAAQCIGTNTGVKLDCTGDSCVCSENGVVGKTVDFQDSFCGTDTAAALDAANSACDWKL